MYKKQKGDVYSHHSTILTFNMRFSIFALFFLVLLAFSSASPIDPAIAPTWKADAVKIAATLPLNVNAIVWLFRAI